MTTYVGIVGHNILQYVRVLILREALGDGCVTLVGRACHDSTDDSCGSRHGVVSRVDAAAGSNCGDVL
jgi:hypothetical protein